MAFDTPTLGGYRITNPPNSMLLVPEVVQQVNELADGSHRQRIIGYRMRAILSWEENWVRSQDLTGLIAVANDASATLTFLPRTDTYPTRTFEVLWLNKFNFMYHKGRFGYYGGSIELVTPSVTSTVGDLP